MANPCCCCSLGVGVKIASILSIACAIVVVGVAARVFHIAHDSRDKSWEDMKIQIKDFIFILNITQASAIKGLDILLYTSGVVVIAGGLQFFTSLFVLLLSGKKAGLIGKFWVFSNTIVAIALLLAFICVATTDEYTGYKKSDLLQAYLGVTIVDFFILFYLHWVHVEFVRAS